jgi:hypothetical protein
VPYYFGNCDVMIDVDAFEKIRSVFRTHSLIRHPYVSADVTKEMFSNSGQRLIHDYFQKLLGDHYVQ